ncbi:Serine hydrolase-like protein [Anthophora quadrimaculata]
MSQMQQEPTEITLPVPWGQIAGKSYGSSNEKKILVVHGVLDNASAFDRLMELLPKEYHYVCIDLPGHGFSSSFPPGVMLNFFDYTYTISLVLDALQWKTCMYIGHSFGAQIGVYFSIIYPKRLEKIVAIDAIMPNSVEGLAPYIRNLYDACSKLKKTEILYTKEEVIETLKFKRHDPLRTEAAEALFKRAVTKVGDLYKYNRDKRLRELPKPLFTKEPQLELIRQFSTPILIFIAVGSYRKVLMQEEVNMILNAAGKSKVSVIPVKGNHDVHNNFPERLAPHITNFLNGTLQSKL